MLRCCDCRCTVAIPSLVIWLDGVYSVTRVLGQKIRSDIRDHLNSMSKTQVTFFFFDTSSAKCGYQNCISPLD